MSYKAAIEDFGMCVYATQAISKNTRIIDYAWRRCPPESALSARRAPQERPLWCFKLTNRTVIEAGRRGGNARVHHHACKPNCYSPSTRHDLDPRGPEDRKGED